LLGVVCAGVLCVGVLRVVPDVLDLGGCVNATAPAVSSVSTDATRVARLFPGLGPVRAVHWQSREARPRTCPEVGPMDYFYEGVVELRPEAVDRSYRWMASTPDLMPALRQYAPPNPAWQQSHEFHDAVAGAADTSSFFYVDLDSATMYFITGTD
jgi:hypothetical protein